MMVTRMGSRVNSQAFSLSETRVTGGLRDGSGVLRAENEKPIDIKTWRTFVSHITVFSVYFV